MSALLLLRRPALRSLMLWRGMLLRGGGVLLRE